MDSGIGVKLERRKDRGLSFLSVRPLCLLCLCRELVAEKYPPQRHRGHKAAQSTLVVSYFPQISSAARSGSVNS